MEKFRSLVAADQLEEAVKILIAHTDGATTDNKRYVNYAALQLQSQLSALKSDELSGKVTPEVIMARRNRICDALLRLNTVYYDPNFKDPEYEKWKLLGTGKKIVKGWLWANLILGTIVLVAVFFIARFIYQQINSTADRWTPAVGCTIKVVTGEVYAEPPVGMSEPPVLAKIGMNAPSISEMQQGGGDAFLNGETLEVLEVAEDKGMMGNGRYYKVKYKGMVGWVNSLGHVTADPSCLQKPK